MTPQPKLTTWTDNQRWILALLVAGNRIRRVRNTTTGHYRWLVDPPAGWHIGMGPSIHGKTLRTLAAREVIYLDGDDWRITDKGRDLAAKEEKP